MAQTVETYTGDGSTKIYTIPFPYIETTDVKAKINGTLTTAFTFANATQLEFTTAPANGNKILIFRQTDDSAAKKEFSAGSALKAEDLNANTKQALFINQESTNQAASTLGATFVGDVEFGFGNVIKFEGASDDAHETTLTVTDPTADRTLSLPNVSGTLVSTGDTGTITSTMILNETIESGDIKNGTIVNDDISGTANIANTKIADGLLKSTLTVNSSNIVDGSIVNADINASADIQGSKLLNDSVTLDKLGSGALPTDITVASANIVDGTIVDADINSSANIDGDKLKDDSVSLAKFEGGALPTDITVASANIVNGTIVDADINATANINGSKILDDSLTLDKLGAGALPTDITVASSNLVNGTIVDEDINASADIEGSKLKNDSVPLTKFGSGALPTDITVNSSNIVDRSIVDGDIALGTLDNRYFTEVELNSGQLDNQYYTETELDNGQLNNLYYTETELNNGQLNNLYFTETELLNGALDGRYFTETEAEANFLRQDSSETIASGVAWSSVDSKVATTAAIDARIIDLVDDVGGFVPIANETSFPTANPDINNPATGGTIVSVKGVSTTLTPSSGSITIANGRGTGLPVIITGVTGVIPQGFGMLVETTTTDHTYAFHRLQAKATEVNTVATNIGSVVTAATNVADINNFADKYLISATAPTQRADGTALQNGDLWYDSSNTVMMVFDGSAGDGFSAITPNQATITNINTVAGHVTFSEDLGSITDAINTGSGNNSINTVGASIANVNTVAADLNEATSEIDTVATSIANVNIVGNDIANVNAVAAINSNVTSVANNETNINAVKNNATNINAVAANNANITAVKNNETNINAVQANASNINAAVSNASNINAVVSNASNINTVSASIADVNRYAAEYLIQSNQPSSPSAGDLWYNTTANNLNYYTGGSWVAIAAGIAGVINDPAPNLGANLDCNDKNLVEVGTVSGDNLQIDFGTL